MVFVCIGLAESIAVKRRGLVDHAAPRPVARERCTDAWEDDGIPPKREDFMLAGNLTTILCGFKRIEIWDVSIITQRAAQTT